MSAYHPFPPMVSKRLATTAITQLRTFCATGYNATMLVISLMLVGVVIGVSLFASVVAAVSRLLTRKDALSVTFGTLFLPALICGSLIYWMTTTEADDAPPGMVIMGNLTAIAIITPFSLLASLVTVKLLAHRSARNGS